MGKARETLLNMWRIKDLRMKILITLLFAAIYRFGSFVVLPGIDPGQLARLHEQTNNGLMQLLNMFLIVHLFQYIYQNGIALLK